VLRSDRKSPILMPVLSFGWHAAATESRMCTVYKVLLYQQNLVKIGIKNILLQQNI